MTDTPLPEKALAVLEEANLRLKAKKESIEPWYVVETYTRLWVKYIKLGMRSIPDLRFGKHSGQMVSVKYEIWKEMTNDEKRQFVKELETLVASPRE
jgi:hypothetical protein